MRYKQMAVYRFAELSEQAKQHAKDEYANAVGYDWGHEAMGSLRAIARHFGGELTDWSIDWADCDRCSAEFAMPDLDHDEIAERLAELGAYNPDTLKGLGECKLTGYCADEDAIDGFRRAFMAGEDDLSEFMRAAFEAWIRAAVADYGSQFEDEHFAETCDSNGWEFDETGELI